jgi:hypothetical protein
VDAGTCCCSTICTGIAIDVFAYSTDVRSVDAGVPTTCVIPDNVTLAF